jgi:hypothetical protein
MAAWWPHGKHGRDDSSHWSKISTLLQSQGIKQTSDSFLEIHVSFSHVSVINKSRNRRADVMFEIKEPLGDLMQASLMPCYSGTAGRVNFALKR